MVAPFYNPTNTNSPGISKSANLWECQMSVCFNFRHSGGSVYIYIYFLFHIAIFEKWKADAKKMRSHRLNHTGTMASSSTLSGRQLPLQPLSWSQTNEFPPIQCTSFSWCLSSCSPSAGAQSECVWVSPCIGPLRGIPGTPEALPLTQPQSPLGFTARS